jgi:magnesium-transporting ATPase (P-type)
MVLWVAAIFAFAADVQMPGQGMATLAIAIVAVILVNGAFSFWQEYRAEETMADDNFASIVNGIEEGRTVFENIRKFRPTS